MSGMTTLPDDLRQFIGACRWTFAKTMPKWPHEYIVRARVDEGRFVRLVDFIRASGYEGKFYEKPITYFDMMDSYTGQWGHRLRKRPSSTGAGGRILMSLGW